MAREPRRKSPYECAQDELVKDFNCVYRFIEARREKSAFVLADKDTNVWTRKKALDEVLNCNNAQKALVRIMGGLEDAMEETGFIPSMDYTLGVSE